MLAKEEAAKNKVRNDFSDVIREARRIRGEYKKSGRQLPVPLLSKRELDRLQKECLEASDIRRFSYLERIRADLTRSSEIEPRSRNDLRSILAQRNISELRSRLYDKTHREQSEKGYYRRFDIGGKPVSLADLDRERKERDGSASSFLEKLKTAASQLSKNRKTPTQANRTDHLRNEIAENLAEQLATIERDGKIEQSKAKILASILNGNPESDLGHGSYSPEQTVEMEKLSVQLKLKHDYENNWKEQRLIIESAGRDSVAYRKLLNADPTTHFTEHKNRVVAGRSLAREIVARVEFDKAKEDLKIFQDGKRFQKFGIPDQRSVSIRYLSLHDVDLSGRSSLLDRAVNELFESRQHRKLRQTVSGLVEDKERRLKGDVAAAKEIMVSASRSSSEFKEFSYLGFKSRTGYRPIFTSSEIAMLERRASNTHSPKEAQRLRLIIDSADGSLRSLSDLLGDFQNPEQVRSEVKKIAIPTHDGSKGDRQEKGLERSTVLRRSERSVEGHSR